MNILQRNINKQIIKNIDEGNLFFNNKEFDKAMECYKANFDLSFKNYYVLFSLFNYSVCLFKFKKFEEASKYLKICIDNFEYDLEDGTTLSRRFKEENLFNMYYNYIFSLLQMKKPYEAKEELELLKAKDIHLYNNNSYDLKELNDAIEEEISKL